MSMLEYVVSGSNAWLVQIVFLVMVGLPIGVWVSNSQGYKLKKMQLEFDRDEASEKRRMEQLVLEHKKPEPSKEVAVIEHEPTSKPRRSRAKA